MKTFALHAIQAKSYHMLGQRITLKDKIKWDYSVTAEQKVQIKKVQGLYKVEWKNRNNFLAYVMIIQ